MANLSVSEALALLMEQLSEAQDENDETQLNEHVTGFELPSICGSTNLNEEDTPNIRPTSEAELLVSIEPEICMKDVELMRNDMVGLSSTDDYVDQDDLSKDPDFNLSACVREEGNADEEDTEDFTIIGTVEMANNVPIDDTSDKQTNPDEQTGGLNITTSINESDQIATPSAVVDQVQKKSKKRPRNPDDWQKNKRKKLRAQGMKYTTVSGKTVPVKSVGTPCKCRAKCFEKLGNSQIQKLFTTFYNLSDEKLQDTFLFGCINRGEPKRRRPRVAGSTKGRGSTYTYTVKNEDNADTTVCRAAFMSIFAIGKTRFERIRTNSTAPEFTKRGQHGKQPRKSEETLQQIRSHIESFPRRSSHYSRKDNQGKVYLNESLNVHRMWILYLELHEPHQYELFTSGGSESMKPSVTYNFYLNIFKTEYNVGFGSPRSDTCLKCDQINQQMKVADDNDKKKKLEEEIRLHHAKAESAYKMLEKQTQAAKVDPDVDVYTFDFEQNLPSPNLSTNDLFYKRLLWTYNFGVHDLRNNDAIMNLWCEADAGRGAAEVCSCLLKVLKQRARQAKHLVLFSDGCSGQNKNKGMVAFLQYLVEKKIYDRVDHIFLFRGHTFLPNDRDFALIEVRKRVERAMVPSDYVKIIEESRQSHPFIVNTIKGEEILDFMKCANDSLPKTGFKDTSGVKLSFNDVHWFSYGQSEQPDPTLSHATLEDHPTEMWCRYTVNEFEPWKKVTLYKRGVQSLREVERKYTQPLKIKEAKLKDLLELCNKGIIPPEATTFYQSLSAGLEEDNADDYVD